jgi:hypothetical protein
MRHTSRLLVSSLAALSLLSASVSAHAQDTYYPPPAPNNPPPPPPNGPPPPSNAVAPNGQYVAPLRQDTQQTYVPQSVAMSGPRKIEDWDETQPVPPGYHVATHVRKGMIVGGSVLFGTLWLISILTAAGSADSTPAGQSNGDADLFIPVAGPFLQMTTTSSSTGNVFLAIDGIGQCAGLAMLIYGIASPQTLLVRNDLGITKPIIAPIKMGRDGYGAGMMFQF